MCRLIVSLVACKWQLCFLLPKYRNILLHRNTFLICNQKTINQPFTVQNLLRSMPLSQWTMNFCKNNEFIFAISCKTSRNKRASNQNSDFSRLLQTRSMYHLFNQLYSIVKKKTFWKLITCKSWLVARYKDIFEMKRTTLLYYLWTGPK